MNDVLTIGVLGLQGAFAKHLEVLTQLGVSTKRVRLPSDLEGLDGLVLPGGESTTMSNLLISSGLLDPLREALKRGLPAFGTCAGLILLANDVLDGRSDQVSLKALDATVRRNAYGRQVDSFEDDVVIAGDPKPFHAVFIRAPMIQKVGSTVEVLAQLDSQPILIRQGQIMACSFHPELAGDGRIHKIFLDLVRQHQQSLTPSQSTDHITKRDHLSPIIH